MIQVASVEPMRTREHPSNAETSNPRGGIRRLSSYDDDALMRRAQDGDREAYEVLVTRYADMVVSLAVRFLGDEDAGRDVAQDVFLELWLNRQKYQPGGKFKGYLTTLLLNRCRDATRRKGSEQRRRRGLATEPQEPAFPDPMNRMAREQSSSRLNEALNQLDPADRELIVMRYGMELSYDEIARHVGRPVGTLRSRVFHTLRKLRGLLEGES